MNEPTVHEDNRNEDEATVPYYIYEGSMVRAERYFRRLLIALIVALSLIVVNNIAWMYFVSVQHPTEVVTEETE